MSQAAPDSFDNLRTALTAGGMGMVLLEVVRRTGDAWQKRQQAQADRAVAQSKKEADAAFALRLYLEQRAQNLEAQVQRLAEDAADRERRYQADAADRERRFQAESASLVRRIEEAERREGRLTAAMGEFLGVLSALMPGMPDTVQRRVQNALDRLRQVSGLG